MPRTARDDDACRFSTLGLCAPDELAAPIERDLLLVEPGCSAVIAVVVGHVDGAREARGVDCDVGTELVVAGRVALCCQRSGE